MKRIAIIKTRDSYSNYDDYDKVIEKITDFEDVTDEVFDKLHKAQYDFGFTVVEIPTSVKEFVQNTLADYVALVNRQEEIRRKADEASRKKNAEAKAKKKALADAKERKTLEDMLKSQLAAGRITSADVDRILNPGK